MWNEITICYEDHHLLIIDKEIPMTTQPALTSHVRQALQKKYQKTGNLFLQPAHRLDKPVTGLVLFAKSSKALSRLHRMISERKLKKIYHAWVTGSPPHPAGTLIHHLKHGKFKSEISKQGKEAILKYRILKRNPHFSVIEVELVTGRYHQIRAQLSAIGCPIIEDKKYGGTSHPTVSKQFQFPKGGIGLRQVALDFTHPVSGCHLAVSSRKITLTP